MFLTLSSYYISPKIGLHPKSKRILNKQLINISNLNDSEKYVERDLELQKFLMLLNQLMVLLMENHNAYQYFSGKIKNCESQAEYLGFRTEITIAAILGNLALNFQKTESPDFTVSFNETVVLIGV